MSTSACTTWCVHFACGITFYETNVVTTPNAVLFAVILNRGAPVVLRRFRSAYIVSKLRTRYHR